MWSNHATNQNNGIEHHRDRQWMPQTVLIDTEGVSDFSFAWDIVSDRGLSMGGWTIDNVCVYGVVQPLEPEDEDPSKSGCACDNADLTSNGSHRQWLLGAWLLGVMLLRRRN